MESALIVCEMPKSSDYFRDILLQNKCDDIQAVRTGQEARRILAERDFDLCIINAPLKDEYGENLSKDISTHYLSQIILVVKAELYDEVTEKVEDYGVLTVPKPINKSLLWSAIKYADTAMRRMNNIRKQNEKLMQKLDDVRNIGRAKLLLITYMGMSEEEAHRYIEKQAMDMRMTKREVADNILKTYDS